MHEEIYAPSRFWFSKRHWVCGVDKKMCRVQVCLVAREVEVIHRRIELKSELTYEIFDVRPHRSRLTFGRTPRISLGQCSMVPAELCALEGCSPSTPHDACRASSLWGGTETLVCHGRSLAAASTAYRREAPRCIAKVYFRPSVGATLCTAGPTAGSRATS